jgi:hypothetical protein
MRWLPAAMVLLGGCSTSNLNLDNCGQLVRCANPSRT